MQSLIAKASEADQYAPGAYGRAQADLALAEGDYEAQRGKNLINTAARAATQEAEDARLLSIQQRRQEQARMQQQEQEQRAEQARVQALQAQQKADHANLQREQAELREQQAEQRTRQAEQQ